MTNWFSRMKGESSSESGDRKGKKAANDEVRRRVESKPMTPREKALDTMKRWNDLVSDYQQEVDKNLQKLHNIIEEVSKDADNISLEKRHYSKGYIEKARTNQKGVIFRQWKASLSKLSIEQNKYKTETFELRGECDGDASYQNIFLDERTSSDEDFLKEIRKYYAEINAQANHDRQKIQKNKEFLEKEQYELHEIVIEK